MIYKVILRTVIEAGPLAITEERTFHTMGNHHTIDEMNKLAHEQGFSCTMVPIAVDEPQGIMRRFMSSVENAKKGLGV